MAGTGQSQTLSGPEINCLKYNQSPEGKKLQADMYTLIAKSWPETDQNAGPLYEWWNLYGGKIKRTNRSNLQEAIIDHFVFYEHEFSNIYQDRKNILFQGSSLGSPFCNYLCIIMLKKNA